MKAKVKLFESRTGKELCLIVKLENTEADKYDFTWNCLSDNQRSKIERFFGKMNAYYTSHEIIKTY